MKAGHPDKMEQYVFDLKMLNFNTKLSIYVLSWLKIITIASKRWNRTMTIAQLSLTSNIDSLLNTLNLDWKWVVWIKNTILGKN